MLILENFQAGLSFECVLNKRENFRLAYDNFDRKKVMNYGEEKIKSLLENKGIIRNKLKVLASVKNAKIFDDIVLNYGSFKSYLKEFWKGEIVYEEGRTTSLLSNAISKDLIKRGMKYVGSIIIYSYLQAIGIINSHEKECFLYKKSKKL
jgi:DNA-3-methyladenine glycosylase I